MGKEAFARDHLQPPADPQTHATATRRCKSCHIKRADRPLRDFVRSVRPHGPLEVFVGCGVCSAKQRGLSTQEFEELFTNPDKLLYAKPHGQPRLCSQCGEWLRPRCFVRTLASSVPATSKPGVCNLCCIANGEMEDEWEVDYPLQIDLMFEPMIKCIACHETQTPHAFLRSEVPGEPALEGWSSCNHCAMRRGRLTVDEFRSLYHGPREEEFMEEDFYPM